MYPLVTCPFCRELFSRAEATLCPSCGLPLLDIAKLPLSYDAQIEDNFGIPREPHLEPLPLRYFRRGRGALLVVALLGLSAFFAPWVCMSAPELHTYSGAELGGRLHWLWGAGIGWFVMIPLVFTRRSIDKMRGARVAASFLSAVPLVAAGILLTRPPHARYGPTLFDWGWGLWMTLFLGIFGLAFAVRFGGRIDDIEVRGD